MSVACPFCAADLADGARTCPSCGETVVQACPFCAEEILARARICRWCKSDLASPIGEGVRAPTPEEARRANSLGEERGLTVVILLGLITCGIYAFYDSSVRLNAVTVAHNQANADAISGGDGGGIVTNNDNPLPTRPSAA